MLTRNFYSAIFAATTGKTVANGFTDSTGTVRDALPPNTFANVSAFGSLYNAAIGPISASAHGVRFGTGVTPATPNDYTLANMLVEGCTCQIPNGISMNVESDILSVSATYSVTNTGSESLAISEIGAFGNQYIDSTTRKTVLLDRTVLDEPITINPYETKQVTYTIRMNYPTA